MKNKELILKIREAIVENGFRSCTLCESFVLNECYSKTDCYYKNKSEMLTTYFDSLIDKKFKDHCDKNILCQNPDQCKYCAEACKGDL